MDYLFLKAVVHQYPPELAHSSHLVGNFPIQVNRRAFCSGHRSTYPRCFLALTLLLQMTATFLLIVAPSPRSSYEYSHCISYASNRVPGRMPTQTLRLAGRILHAMNRSDNDHSYSQVREAVGELVHHNDERTPEQKEEYRLMAAFIARMCVAGSGKKALSWPSACNRGFLGLVDAAYSVLGKVSCNVSHHACGCCLFLGC